MSYELSEYLRRMLGRLLGADFKIISSNKCTQIQIILMGHHFAKVQ